MKPDPKVVAPEFVWVPQPMNRHDKILVWLIAFLTIAFVCGVTWRVMRKIEQARELHARCARACAPLPGIYDSDTATCSCLTKKEVAP